MVYTSPGASTVSTTRAAYLDNINNTTLLNLNVSSNGIAYIDAGEVIATYPLLAAGVDVASSATAWNWGSYTEIVPASTITNDFLLLGFIFEEGGVRSGVFEFAKGAAASEVTVIQTGVAVGEKSSVGQKGLMRCLFAIPILVAANSRIACRITDNQSSAITWDGIKIIYVEV